MTAARVPRKLYCATAAVAGATDGDWTLLTNLNRHWIPFYSRRHAIRKIRSEK